MVRARSFAAHVGLCLLTSSVACNLELEQARRGLVSDDPAARAEAVQRIGEMRDPAKVDLVLPLLKDGSAGVRRRAVVALGMLGDERRRWGLAAIPALQDRDLEVRLAAVRVIGDSRDPRAASALLGKLQDSSVVVRRAASQALTSLGLTPSVQAARLAEVELSDHLRRLARGDDATRIAAVRMVGLSGRARGAPALVAALADASPALVLEAARGLGRIGGAEARRSLVGLARGRQATDRAAAAAGLAALGDGAAVHEIAGLLEDPVALVRRAALEALEDVPSTAGSELVAARVCAALLSSEEAVAVRAARVVHHLGLGCSSQVEQLCLGRRGPGGRDDPTGEWRWRVLTPIRESAPTRALLQDARALYEEHRGETTPWIPAERWKDIDGEGGAVVPPVPPMPPSDTAERRIDPRQRAALQRLLSRFPEPARGGTVSGPLLPPRVDAAALMDRIAGLEGRAEARPWLAQVAVEGSPVLRAAALRALGVAEAEARPSSPPARSPSPGPGAAPTSDTEPEDPAERAVWKGLRSEAPEVRRSALESCAVLGSSAVDVALRLLADQDFEVRGAAARCLGALREVRAVPVLVRTLDTDYQLEVVRALGQIGDRRATSILAARLTRTPSRPDDPGERVALVETLGQLGDPSAAPALEHELSDPAPAVRLAAARALVKSGRRESREPLVVCQNDYFAEIRGACGAALRGLRP